MGIADALNKDFESKEDFAKALETAVQDAISTAVNGIVIAPPPEPTPIPTPTSPLGTNRYYVRASDSPVGAAVIVSEGLDTLSSAPVGGYVRFVANPVYPDTEYVFDGWYDVTYKTQTPPVETFVTREPAAEIIVGARTYRYEARFVRPGNQTDRNTDPNRIMVTLSWNGSTRGATIFPGQTDPKRELTIYTQEPEGITRIVRAQDYVEATPRGRISVDVAKGSLVIFGCSSTLPVTTFWLDDAGLRFGQGGELSLTLTENTTLYAYIE